MRTALATLALTGLLACTGDTGPAGPTGPQGDHAMTESATLTTTLDAKGTGGVKFRVNIGTDPTRPPLIQCYVTEAASGVWHQVADGYTANTSPLCGLSFVGGVWHATIVRGPAFWTAMFVATRTAP